MAQHQTLVGDNVAGPEEMLRIRPSRFTIDGVAIDPGGAVCRDVACPRCHLEMARVMLHSTPLFLSIIGAPAAGKSYFLAAMSWQMRTLLPKLGWNLLDAHPTANTRLHMMEQQLFVSATPEQPTFIRKTNQATNDGDLYRSVRIDGKQVAFPRPFQFVISPNRSNRQLRTSLVLFDNAGEHFLPGASTGNAPVTGHLANSRVLMFLLDPTQDPRMRPLCDKDDREVQGGPRGRGHSTEMARQETILNEVGFRIREPLGMPPGTKLKVPLVVIIAKADLLTKVLGDALDREPIRVRSSGSLGLDVGVVKEVSDRCRAALLKCAPEFIAAAENLSATVLYVPVSSLGQSADQPVQQKEHVQMGVRPCDIKPRWVSIPLLVAMESLDPLRAAPPAGGAAASPSAAAGVQNGVNA